MSERDGSLIPYLRLLRAPAVFTALADPLAGALIARGGLPPGRAARVAGSAAALYLAGMALNDVADREEDARERPDRPIPSGAVSAGGAAALGGGLLLGGVLAARRAGAGRTGAALAAMILGYDFAFKRSAALGPAAMGSCRALSLLLGAESAGGRSGIRKATSSGLLLSLYVAGITVLARGETGDGAGSTSVGVGLAAAALVGAAGRGRRALPWVALAAALAGPAAVRALRRPEPARVGPAVGALIRAIPAFDAALAAPRAPTAAAALALPLLALARWGRKLIPIT